MLRYNTSIQVWGLRPLHQTLQADTKDIEYLPTETPEEIVQRIKKSGEIKDKAMPTTCDEPTVTQATEHKKQLSIHARTRDLVQNKVSFNPQMRTFNVKGTSDITRVVTLYTCSCSSTGVCYYILAMKMSLEMRETMLQTKKTYQSFKKTHDPEKKNECGRKRPQPNDVKTEDDQIH